MTHLMARNAPGGPPRAIKWVMINAPWYWVLRRPIVPIKRSLIQSRGRPWPVREKEMLKA